MLSSQLRDIPQSLVERYAKELNHDILEVGDALDQIRLESLSAKGPYFSKPVRSAFGMVTSQSVIDFKHCTENTAVTENIYANSGNNPKDLVTRRNRIKNWAKNAVRKCNSTIFSTSDSFRWLQDLDSQSRKVSSQVLESVFNKLCSENIDLTAEPYSDSVRVILSIQSCCVLTNRL